MRQGAGRLLAALRAAGARGQPRSHRLRRADALGRAERRDRQPARPRRGRRARLERKLPRAAARIRPRRARARGGRAREHLGAARRASDEPDALGRPARLPDGGRRPELRVHDPAVRRRLAREREQGARAPGERRLDSDERRPGGSRVDGERGWRSRCWQVLSNSERALAIELLAGAQAVEFLAPLEPGGGTRALARRRSAPSSPALDEDRPLAPDIELVADAIRFRGAPAARSRRSGSARVSVRSLDATSWRSSAATSARFARRAEPTLNARSWQTEAPLRMLLNNLDPEVAERPEELVVYGGSGKAARNPAGSARTRPLAPDARRRRDPARPERQAGRRLSARTPAHRAC